MGHLCLSFDVLIVLYYWSKAGPVNLIIKDLMYAKNNNNGSTLDCLLVIQFQ